MPTPPTYPGVYIEELSSGVRTITGVATSITAFIGRARRGPVNRPLRINNFGDFERRFGGLWSEGPMSYAVRDFYLNGGSAAIIVRLFNPTGEGPNRVTFEAEAETETETLVLEAKYEGSWALPLEVSAQPVDSQFEADIASNLEVGTDDLFNLIVNDPGTGLREVFNNVTVVESRRRVDRVLENESALIRVADLPDSFTVPDEGLQLLATPAADATTQLAALDGQDLVLGNYFTPVDPDAEEAPPDDYRGDRTQKRGVFALEDADLFNLLCIPPYSFQTNGDVEDAVWAAAADYAKDRRAMLIVDPPRGWRRVENVTSGLQAISNAVSANRKNAAIFFPRLRKPNPIRDNQQDDFAPCGAVAGVIARTDAQRGVWKAPAGLEAGLVGVPSLSVPLTDDENGQLNPLGVNCLRLRPAAGHVVWGARTLDGNDQLASDWKYLPVRRTALFIEESLYRGTQWAVFEPNDEPLWAELRLNIGAFMQNLFRQGAFQGQTPKEAYFVKCDSETTTQNDINLGIVNIVVGFAALKPAEFIYIFLQQIAGQIQT